MFRTKQLWSLLVALVGVVVWCYQAVAAAPPVRIAVVTGGGSGIEQEIVDKISNEIQNNPNVSISTVNPDWFVVCNVKEFMDQMSGQIRYNGNVIIKTAGKGQIIDTVAVQKYNQDYSVTPGAPLNKVLVDRAAKEATSAAASRTIPAIERAVATEMETREKIIRAQIMAEEEQYDGAINSLRLVSPDSPHFENARDLMGEFSMEKQAMESLKQAQAQAASGKYGAALASLKTIPAKSKYRAKANALASSYSAHSHGSAPKKLVKNNKSTTSSSTKTASSGGDAELKALDKVLKLEKKAIEDAQSQVNKRLNK